MTMYKDNARITMVNGPVVEADNMTHFQMREMVMVGQKN